MKNELEDYDDVGEALREDRPLRAAKAYGIRLADEDLAFRTLKVPDPVPTGRQILAAAGVDARSDVILFAILSSGDFEDVRLDETIDLRGREAERFIAFHTDREFKFTLDGKQLAWGKPRISGAALYKLADTNDDDRAVFLDVPGGEDRLIDEDELIELDESGTERFITADRPAPCYVIIVNARDESVEAKRVTFEQVVQLAFPGAPALNNVSYSMTYRNAASCPQAGELGEGGSVEVKKQGTIFNVTKTVQS